MTVDLGGFPWLSEALCRRETGSAMKSRFLSPSEKRDVAVAAMEALKIQNPGCLMHVDVDDWTDSKGIPQWTATVKPATHERPDES